MVFREAELLKSLDHPNIVKIISCYTLKNMQVIFVMEYLEGGELLEYLECIIDVDNLFYQGKGNLAEDEARLFFI
jgi:MAP/microtubule affinity-regulating kinase